MFRLDSVAEEYYRMLQRIREHFSLGFSMPRHEDEDVFELSDLPDLEVLLWKVVHQMLVGYEISYDDNEMEMIQQVAKAVCPICTGTGQDGMSRDGQPTECRTCKGRGR